MCEPWGVDAAKRCAYVSSDVCSSDGIDGEMDADALAALGNGTEFSLGAAGSTSFVEVLSVQTYLQVFFCGSSGGTDWFAGAAWLALFALVLVALFYTLFSTADTYFTPPLRVLSDRLHLNNAVAGVTLLAFGNGAPDLFSAFAALRGDAVGLAIGGLLGGAAFISLIVLSWVITVSLYSRRERVRVDTGHLIRTAFVFFVTVTVIVTIIWDLHISLWESLLIVGLYLAYVVVVFAASTVDRRQKIRALEEHGLMDISLGTTQGPPGTLLDITVRMSGAHTINRRAFADSIVDLSAGPERVTEETRLLEKLRTDTQLKVKVGDVVVDPAWSEEMLAAGVGNVLQVLMPAHVTNSEMSRLTGVDVCLVYDLMQVSQIVSFQLTEEASALGHHGISETSPLVIDTMDDFGGAWGSSESGSNRCSAAFRAIFRWFALQTQWHDKSNFERILVVVSSPLILIRLLTIIPITSPGSGDEGATAVPTENLWYHRGAAAGFVFPCSLFLVFFIAAVPIDAVIAEHNAVGKYIPAVAVVAAVDALLAVAIYFSSPSDGSNPKYMMAIVLWSWIMAVGWVFSLADQIVDILRAMGVIAQVGDVLIGMTVLAWANSLGDVAANTAVTKFGLGEMAVSAALGGPLLNLLLGIGLPFTLLTIEKNGDVPLPFDPHVLLLALAVVVGLVVTSFGAALSRGRLGFPVIIGLVSVYLVLLAGTIFVALSPAAYQWLRALHD